MKPTKVTYEELFPIGSYLNARLGLEFSISNESDIEPTLDKAKKLLSDWHKKNFPLMYIDEVPNKTYFDAPQEQRIQTPEEIITEIGTCMSIKLLETYRFVAQTNTNIMYAYHKKLKNLTVI